MTKTTTKQVSFEKVMVNFKKFTSKSNDRKVLQYVYFDGTHFIATNGHAMMKVNKEYISNIPNKIAVGSMYDPVKMEVYTDSLHPYPNTSRIVPENFNLRIRINNTLNEIQSYIKQGNALLKDAKPSMRSFKFYTQDDFLKIDSMNLYKQEIVDEAIMRHNHYLESNGEEIVFTLASEYITNALVVAKKLSRLSAEDVELKLISEVMPVIISQSDVFTILILPIRTF